MNLIFLLVTKARACTIISSLKNLCLKTELRVAKLDGKRTLLDIENALVAALELGTRKLAPLVFSRFRTVRGKTNPP